MDVDINRNRRNRRLGNALARLRATMVARPCPKRVPLDLRLSSASRCGQALQDEIQRSALGAEPGLNRTERDDRSMQDPARQGSSP